MRIVFLGTRGFPNIQGGVEKHCQELTPSLVKLGCEVIVFTRAPYVDKKIKEFNGVMLVALPAFRIKSLETLLHTFIGVFVALRYRPDILHIQAIGPGFFTPLARLLGMKVVLTSHGANYKHLKWGRFARLFLKISEYLAVTFSNRIVVVSSVIADEIKHKYNKAVVIIPNGALIPEKINTFEILNKYQLEEGKYIFVAGRFVPEKGFHDLIDAFVSLGYITNGWRLVIAGDADHEDKYSRELKQKAKDAPNVILTGFLTGRPLQELYAHAGLFILPSYYEGLPIALLEAMSYGLSCVVSDIPANREVGLAQERYFKAGDIQAMSEKIREFINRPLSANERNMQIKLVKEKYDWGRIAEATLRVYEEVLVK